MTEDTPQRIVDPDQFDLAADLILGGLRRFEDEFGKKFAPSIHTPGLHLAISFIEKYRKSIREEASGNQP